MKSTAKVLVKIEVCRSLLDGVWSDEAAPTIEYMKAEFDSAFVGLVAEMEPRDIKQAMDFTNKNTEKIRDYVPDNMTALFLVSSITHMLGDLEGTNKYKHVDSIVEASYSLEEFAEKDSDEERMLAGRFAGKLESLMNE